MRDKKWQYPLTDIFKIIHQFDMSKEKVESIYVEARCEEFWDEYTKWLKKNKKAQERVHDYLSFSFFSKVLHFFNRK